MNDSRVSEPVSESVEYEVEKVVDVKQKGGSAWYKIKWKGYNNRYNVWRPESELGCAELIAEFELSRGSGRAGLRSGAVANLFAMLVTSGAAAAATESELLCLPSDDVRTACEYLHGRQGVAGDACEFYEGYRIEIDHMLHRRLRLLDDDEAAAVEREHTIVSMRPVLEAKKDGRRKMRLVVQGFKEPLEWDLESNMSPVALTSAVRMLVYAAGRADEVIGCIDACVCSFPSSR